MNASSEPNLRNPLSVHAVLEDDSASLAKDGYGTAAMSSVDHHNEVLSSIRKELRTIPERLR